MEQVLGKLYVGSDADFDKLQASKNSEGWSVLRCCKEGAGGHRQTLGYATQGAPKGKGYLSAHRRKGAVIDLSHMALNFIDPHDPHYIQREMLTDGLQFIGKRLAAGDKVLVACNAGHSRGPTTAMLYLRATGELPGNFAQGEKVFQTLYPRYEPGIGMRQFARMHWDEFENGELHGR